MDKEQVDDLEEEIEEVEEEKPEPVEDEDRKVLEEEARKYGWRPKAEFDRDPAGWVDADRFLELPTTKVKMHRDVQKHLEKELRERDERLARMEGMTKKAIEAVRRQEEEKYQQQLASLSAAQRRAAEEGDLERFDRLEAQRAKIQPPAPVVDEPAQDDPLAAYRTSEEGKWANDPSAVRFAAQLVEANPHVKYLPPIKQAQWAASQVKDYFPEYFAAPSQPRPAPQRVDGGGLGGSFRRGKGVDDLPPEAAKIAQEFVKEGIFKSVEDYAKDYWAQEAGR